MFKKMLIAGALTAALGLPGIVFAQAAAPADAKAAPKSPHTLTGNFGLFSQYIFRGLTQTDRRPAAQGGFDYSHESGFYAGTWGSNVSWLKENASTATSVQGTYGGGGSLELDFYGGYKWNLPRDVTIDLGTLYYWYPGSINPSTTAAPAGTPKADTWEVYVAPAWKWLSLKYSYSMRSDTFGTKDSKGTSYLDLSANYPIPDTGLTLIAHWGWQKYKGTSPLNAGSRSNDTLFSYKDIKLGLSYALPKDFTVGAYYTKVYNYNKLGYGSVAEGGTYPRNIADGTGTIFIQKTF